MSGGEGGMTQEEASEVNRLCETAKRLWGALHASLLCTPVDQIMLETDGHKSFEGMYALPSFVLILMYKVLI